MYSSYYLSEKQLFILITLLKWKVNFKYFNIHCIVFFILYVYQNTKSHVFSICIIHMHYSKNMMSFVCTLKLLFWAFSYYVLTILKIWVQEFPFGGKILAIYFDLFSICQNHFAHLLLTLSFQCPVLHCAIGKS